jgi:hypothetical protein
MKVAAMHEIDDRHIGTHATSIYTPPPKAIRKIRPLIGVGLFHPKIGGEYQTQHSKGDYGDYEDSGKMITRPRQNRPSIEFPQPRPG